MKWFKLYGQDYLSDPKMLSLIASERSCWLTLLCYSSINDNGMITFLSEQQLMMQAGIDIQSDEWNKTVGVLNKLEKLNIIDIDNGLITVKNWKKRQETSLTSYERVKRHREKKRLDNEKITLEENRIEKNRRDNTNTAEDKPLRVEEKHNKLGSEIIKALEEVDPKNKKYYGNTTQRKACDFLLEEYGLDEVLKRIGVLSKTNKIPYFPTISTPIQLRDKWVALQDAVDRKRGELKTKKEILI